MASQPEMNSCKHQGTVVSEHWERSIVARNFARLVDYPWFCIGTLIAITTFALGGYVRPGWPRDLAGWFVDKPVVEQVKAPRERPFLASHKVKRDSLGRAEALLVMECDAFFTREGAVAIRDVVQSLEKLDTVAGVRWLDQAPPLNILWLAGAHSTQRPSV